MTVICHWEKKRKAEHKMFKLVFKIDLSLFSHWSFVSESQCVDLAFKKLTPGGLMKGTSIIIWIKFYSFPFWQEDLLTAFRYLKGQIRELENNFLQGYVVIRGNGFNLKEVRFTLDIGRKFFLWVCWGTQKGWKVMGVPSLEVFMAGWMGL